MPTKTVDLELDAYEKLENARLPGESFSAVVRRAEWATKPITAGELLSLLERPGPLLSEPELNALDREQTMGKPSIDPWP